MSVLIHTVQKIRKKLVKIANFAVVNRALKKVLLKFSKNELPQQGKRRQSKAQ